MNKKKLLFVNESLTLAGGEKSLVALLSLIDSNKYDIDLQLFLYGGALDSFIPQYVNILPPIPYTQFAAQSWKNNLLSLTSRCNISFLYSKLKYSIRLRCGKFNHPEKAQLYWEAVANSITVASKNYDVAIAYAQGIPTYYVIDKIIANKKIAWVNVNMQSKPKNKVYQKTYYNKYKAIVAVSEGTNKHLRGLFPNLSNKYYTITDIIDYASILKMASFSSKSFDKSCFNILTVARLNKTQKGYDILLEVVKILKDRGVNFHWYAIGEGSYKPEMLKYIEQYKLKDRFTFLGVTANPYPYFKNADLYVQTSRFEGYGLSIAEARLLNVPVVTTRFVNVFMQMVHGKNGLVVDIDANAVADAIERMMNDQQLYDSIVEYLKLEQKENYESVEKFDRLINNRISKDRTKRKL